MGYGSQPEKQEQFARLFGEYRAFTPELTKRLALTRLFTAEEVADLQASFRLAEMTQGDFSTVRVIKEAFTSALPKATFAFVFNTRRAIFADIRVREAIGLLFDFEWVNHSIFYDLYRRNAGYFDGSELSARGRPADARERALLAPFAGAVRPTNFAGSRRLSCVK